MAIIKFNNVGISAISACVPKKVSSNSDLGYLIPSDEIDKTIESIGIKEKRIADSDVCSSDLCIKAAEKLFADNNIERDSIDLVLFLSQTPDFIIPATSPIIQHRLGLPKSTACIDLSLACSGYVYGLSTAFAYASMDGVNRILLLVGETFSKIVNKMDKVNAPLYGDAGTATLIEKEENSKSFFGLYSDGSGEHAVKIPGGAYRHPFTEETLKEQKFNDGSIRSNSQLFMDGMDVFNFAISVVPKGIKEIIKVSSKELEDIDYIVFHQANKFMTDFFIKRLKFDTSKVPYCLSKYGNTSAASVPLTIVSEFSKNQMNNKNVILSGFGAGLSWATAYIETKEILISNLIEF
jgi:3-oxoacyl-[acyl-carrier-protein] synthase III